MKQLSELQPWQVFTVGEKLYRCATDTQCGNPPFITVEITDCVYYPEEEVWQIQIKLLSLGFHDEVLAERITTLPTEISNRTNDIISNDIRVSNADIRDNSKYDFEEEKLGLYKQGTYWYSGCGWFSSKEEAKQFATAVLKGETMTVEQDIRKKLKQLKEIEHQLMNNNGWLQKMRYLSEAFGLNEDKFYTDFPVYDSNGNEMLDSDGNVIKKSRIVENTSYAYNIERTIKRTHEYYEEFRKQSALFDKEYYKEEEK